MEIFRPKPAHWHRHFDISAFLWHFFDVHPNICSAHIYSFTFCVEYFFLINRRLLEWITLTHKYTHTHRTRSQSMLMRLRSLDIYEWTVYFQHYYSTYDKILDIGSELDLAIGIEINPSTETKRNQLTQPLCVCTSQVIDFHVVFHGLRGENVQFHMAGTRTIVAGLPRCRAERAVRPYMKFFFRNARVVIATVHRCNGVKWIWGTHFFFLLFILLLSCIARILYMLVARGSWWHARAYLKFNNFSIILVVDGAARACIHTHSLSHSITLYVFNKSYEFLCI